jgi:hypothetical protein
MTGSSLGEKSGQRPQDPQVVIESANYICDVSLLFEWQTYVQAHMPVPNSIAS